MGRARIFQCDSENMETSIWNTYTLKGGLGLAHDALAVTENAAGSVPSGSDENIPVGCQTAHPALQTDTVSTSASFSSCSTTDKSSNKYIRDITYQYIQSSTHVEFKFSVKRNFFGKGWLTYHFNGVVVQYTVCGDARGAGVNSSPLQHAWHVELLACAQAVVELVVQHGNHCKTQQLLTVAY